MNDNTTTMGSSIESVDLAALLIALDFNLISCNTVEGINLDGGKAPKKTITWKFADQSKNGKHKMSSVRQKWVLPKEFTLDVYKLSRLLAQNLGILKNVSKRPSSLVWNDLGGIGLLSTDHLTNNYRDLSISNRGFGGVCDTNTAALAITLGVIPNGLYVDNGRLYVSFDFTPNAVNVTDVFKMLKDPNMRNVLNDNAIATLICQLDNREVILENIQNMRKKIRLIANGGETQVMFEKSQLDEKLKAKINDFMG